MTGNNSDHTGLLITSYLNFGKIGNYSIKLLQVATNFTIYRQILQNIKLKMQYVCVSFVNIVKYKNADTVPHIPL